ncbi:MAG: hypothetical protein IPP15_16665 [Saprospiraceae bacterium]|uniref:Uncharacterized protein n=1 Tax=Candidatus Opimibacter skivensis TaxID=2982028 RepID=A0A9D7SVH1_9BACT|nr:hypothetical protein [Candidatus Opimibacter skivensis]
MESLKIIPQVFFDLIARVVPGAFGIIAYLLFFDKTWASLVAQIMGESVVNAGASVTIFVFLGASYVAGELISPAAKFVQWFGELKFFRPGIKEKNSYDYLRYKHPYVGGLCAKIRAEFTMHNGMAVVFGLSAAYYPFSSKPWNWYVFCILVTMSLIIAVRGRKTRDTFNKTVLKFAKVVEYDEDKR